MDWFVALVGVAGKLKPPPGAVWPKGDAGAFEPADAGPNEVLAAICGAPNPNGEVAAVGVAGLAKLNAPPEVVAAIWGASGAFCPKLNPPAVVEAGADPNGAAVGVEVGAAVSGFCPNWNSPADPGCWPKNPPIAGFSAGLASAGFAPNIDVVADGAAPNPKPVDPLAAAACCPNSEDGAAAAPKLNPPFSFGNSGFAPLTSMLGGLKGLSSIIIIDESPLFLGGVVGPAGVAGVGAPNVNGFAASVVAEVVPDVPPKSDGGPATAAGAVDGGAGDGDPNTNGFLSAVAALKRNGDFGGSTAGVEAAG